jgi:hypothetical protein
MKKLDVFARSLALGIICWAVPAGADAPVRAYQLQASDQRLNEPSRAGLRVGMLVRLKKRDRAFKPAETGHTATLAYGPGQRGVIVGFIRRRLSGYEFDMAIVRWDRQEWFEWDTPLHRMGDGKVYSGDDLNRMNTENGAPVRLPSFELPAHPETLEPIQANDKAVVAEAAEQSRTRMRALGPPKRTTCTAGTTAVPGQYVIFVRPGFEVQPIADDFAQKPGITVRRVWPALASFSIETTGKSSPCCRIPDFPK